MLLLFSKDRFLKHWVNRRLHCRVLLPLWYCQE